MGMFDKSKNPIMSEERFYNESRSEGISFSQDGVMTTTGAINKTVILTGIMMATALFAYTNPSPLFMIGGAIGGLIMVLIASFKPKTSHITAPIYAAFEGLFVGAISAIYAAAYQGIIFQAVSLTVCILLVMLMIYRSGIIKVDNKFRTGVIAATGGIMLVYLLNFVLGMFGINVPYLHDGGMISIGISLFVVGIGALNLMLDFDTIEKGDKFGAPKYMEWFSAMSLLVTLVWIYIEVLRLLSYLNRD